MRLLCLFFFAAFAATSAENPINRVYDLVVKGGNMRKCNFTLYSHYKDKWQAANNLTCTRNWYSGSVKSADTLRNYYWPWCVQTVDGSRYGRWDSCYEYRWKFTVSKDRQPLRRDMGLRKDYPLTTEYLYRYHNTHTSYSDARKFCWGLGLGWGLATFQSLFVQATLKRYDENKVVSYYENPYWREYERRNYTHWSEQNVIDIISPLQQTFDHFWIRNDDSNEWNGADQDGSKGGLFNFRSYGKPFYWRPYCYYYNAEQMNRGQSPIQWSGCYRKKSFVCERQIKE